MLFNVRFEAKLGRAERGAGSHEDCVLAEVVSMDAFSHFILGISGILSGSVRTGCFRRYKQRSMIAPLFALYAKFLRHLGKI